MHQLGGLQRQGVQVEHVQVGAAARDERPSHPDLVILRATSVQGPDRSTTKRLAAFASSALCSVAGDGSAHTPVTSIDALAEFTVTVGDHRGDVPQIVLLPWEGATTASILSFSLGR